MSGALLSGRSLKKEVPPTTRRCSPTALGVWTVWQPLRELDSHPGKPLDRRPPKEAAGRSSPTFSWIERFGTWTLNSSINRPLIVPSVSHSLTKGSLLHVSSVRRHPLVGLVWSGQHLSLVYQHVHKYLYFIHVPRSSDNPIRYLKVTVRAQIDTESSFFLLCCFPHLILLLSLSRPFSFLLLHFVLQHLGSVAFKSSCISFIPSVT